MEGLKVGKGAEGREGLMVGKGGERGKRRTLGEERRTKDRKRAHGKGREPLR